jgi:hypothetical protein
MPGMNAYGYLVKGPLKNSSGANFEEGLAALDFVLE